MKRIGILSDTHGTFDETLMNFFRDVDELWHAGDIGSIELADRIAAFNQNLGDRAVFVGFNRVKGLHGLNQANDVAFLNELSDIAYIGLGDL